MTKAGASKKTTEAFGLSRPPIWLMLATGALAVTCLVLAIAETNLWGHYLIDGGEFISLFGLGFILIAGIYLFRRRQLFVSLPLVFPWLMYPVITQGDQIIDNFSINPMRLICQILLAGIFAAPIAAVVMIARYTLAPKPGRPQPRHGLLLMFPGLRSLTEGRIREGTGLLAEALILGEIWIAHEFLGTLMVITLLLMAFVVLIYLSLGRSEGLAQIVTKDGRGECLSLIFLITGVAISCALYAGYKHRPGAYQGSPSAFMDPTQKENGYRLDRIAVSARAVSTTTNAEIVSHALISYARTLEQLLAGYHILDRNYTYDFHNHLFLRDTPLITNYRAVGLQKIEEARLMRQQADALATQARATLANNDPLAALLDDVRDYVAYNFKRAPVLEQMSADFERSPAGLQHAAHLYEGESKALGSTLNELLKKYRQVLDSPATKPATTNFVAISQSIYEAYAHHVVGF